VVVRPVEPAITTKDDIPQSEIKPSDIIFCEECGARNILDAEQKSLLSEFKCNQCGDLLEVSLINKYKRINFVTVIGSGLGGYSNLLRVIPQLPNDISGAIFVVLYENDKHVNAFTEYLDAVSSIKVHRMVDGLNIEGGNCYVSSSLDTVFMKPYSAQYTIRKTEPVSGFGPIDLLMNSITSVFKDKVAGFVFSGVDLDGEKGINAIKENNGYSIVLNSGNCLCKEMGENILRKCTVDKIIDEKDAADFIIQLHQASNSESSAA
jgi:chemotaxis response regulator CheB